MTTTAQDTSGKVRFTTENSKIKELLERLNQIEDLAALGALDEQGTDADPPSITGQ